MLIIQASVATLLEMPIFGVVVLCCSVEMVMGYGVLTHANPHPVETKLIPCSYTHSYTYSYT